MNPSNKPIGLALGGGAVLGAAHIGVLKALQEKGVQAEYIAGTSIGAFIAAFHAFGKSIEEIEEISKRLKWLDVAGLTLSKYGLLSFDKLGELIHKHFGEQRIENSQIPLCIVATDISTGEKVVLNSGPLKPAIMASMSIPGIFKPIEIDNRLLVDGGVVENVPISTARDMGAEYVIGVDLNANHIHERPANIIEVLMNSFQIIMQQSTSVHTQHADFLIQPDLSEFSYSDTSQVAAIMDAGYKEMKKAMSDLDRKKY